jgi:hypothetical protein
VVVGTLVVILVVAVGVPAGGTDDLPSDVVPVLSGVEHTPALLERVRALSAEQTVHRRIAVGNVEADDLVVALVLEARGAQKAVS